MCGLGERSDFVMYSILFGKPLLVETKKYGERGGR